MPVSTANCPQPPPPVTPWWPLAATYQPSRVDKPQTQTFINVDQAEAVHEGHFHLIIFTGISVAVAVKAILIGVIALRFLVVGPLRQKLLSSWSHQNRSISHRSVGDFAAFYCTAFDCTESQGGTGEQGTSHR